MKKYAIVISVVLSLILAVFANCAKQTPAEPDLPAATGTATCTATKTATSENTITNTPTCTSTASPTDTVTHTVTATETATATVTKTVMPALLMIDNFEDGDYTNMMPAPGYWSSGWWPYGEECTGPGIPDGTVQYSITGSYSAGSEAFGVSTTVRTGLSSAPYATQFNFQTSFDEPAYLNGIDLRSYMALNYDQLFRVITALSGPGATVTNTIILTSCAPNYNSLSATFSTNSAWESVSIMMTDFTVTSGTMTKEEILSNVIMITWRVYMTSQTKCDIAQYEMYLDNVRFVQP